MTRPRQKRHARRLTGPGTKRPTRATPGRVSKRFCWVQSGIAVATSGAMRGTAIRVLPATLLLVTAVVAAPEAHARGGRGESDYERAAQLHRDRRFAEAAAWF